MDGYIKFAFLTGVTKFGKVSVLSEGRIDLVLQTDRFIYVMEFKLDGTAEEALHQIDEKEYALPFSSDPRRLFRIGVNFSAQTRNIEKWLVR